MLNVLRQPGGCSRANFHVCRPDTSGHGKAHTTTEYHYRTPVTFGLHCGAMLRPREGHDVHIEKLALKVEPGQVRWLRDILRQLDRTD